MLAHPSSTPYTDNPFTLIDDSMHTHDFLAFNGLAREFFRNKL